MFVWTNAKPHRIKKGFEIPMFMWNGPDRKLTNIMTINNQMFCRSHDDTTMINPGPPAVYQLKTKENVLIKSSDSGHIYEQTATRRIEPF